MRQKMLRRINAKFVEIFHGQFYYPMIYASWWHALFHKPKFAVRSNSYLAAVPNPGAGIGHQMANWIAGLWFSRVFSLNHAHIPFSTPQWEALLGFGEGKDTLNSLVKNKGYRKVALPLFDEFNQFEVDRIKKIIASYNNKKIIFVLEQDQFYRDQFGVIDGIKDRFYNAAARTKDQLRYSSEYFNIAIHVRRGDIVVGQINGNPNLLMRWQDTQYFKKILASVLTGLVANKVVKIYIFSQGSREELAEFDEFSNVEYCLEAGAQESFLHMVFADLLITSKSSFSYKPALLSRGIKVSPRNFWHGYPQDKKWIIADEDGNLDIQAMDKLKAAH